MQGEELQGAMNARDWEHSQRFVILGKPVKAAKRTPPYKTSDRFASK